MLLLLFTPLVEILAFKLILMFLIPFIQNYYTFTVVEYHVYILAVSLTVMPCILGVVTGFMMLDERDGKIAELMSVTPLGRSGYLINRLTFSSILTIVYTFICYFVLDISYIPFWTLIFLALLLGTLSAIIGLILFSIATDKVKGLTYAKGLNIFVLFCLADLVPILWLNYLSMLFPSYWITRVIKTPNFGVVSTALLVHAIWLFILLFRDNRKKEH